MKKTIFTFLALVFVSGLAFSQKTLNIPTTYSPLAKITFPAGSDWLYDYENDIFSMYPDDTGESSRLITMMWAPKESNSEEALLDLTDEAYEVIDLLIEDIEWLNEPSTFET